jgi:antitoxin (DNA-binding transcriptional repressor) of toxin-antitoxin stability system
MSPASIETDNSEWVTVREAMRGLNRLVDELEASERGKVVLTRGGKMVAVVVSVGEYAKMAQTPVEMFPAPREDDCRCGCCNAGDVGLCSEWVQS